MEQVIQFLWEYKKFFTIAHVFFVIVGMGSAFVSDVLFNSYIKDKKINPTENATLETLSKVIWAGLAGIILSGFLIFVTDPAGYIHSDKFVLKMVIVLIIAMNGFLFAKITHGSLRKINFSDANVHHKYVRIRRLSFAFGAVSVVSWLSVFMLGSLRFIPVTFGQGFGIYVIVIFIAILASQILDARVVKGG